MRNLSGRDKRVSSRSNDNLGYKSDIFIVVEINVPVSLCRRGIISGV